jgi:hypothetical protein
MVWWHLAGVALSAGWGYLAGDKEVKIPFPNPGHSPRNVVGQLRQRDRAPNLSGSKFIKQASSDLTDSHPNDDPQEQKHLSIYAI